VVNLWSVLDRCGQAWDSTNRLGYACGEGPIVTQPFIQL
jgi:hypothetical protein